ncbi:peroxisomal membrane protein 13-like isoform X1 [Ananas comosus]|uniref:Peroxin-13 n=1 Tax=Ananas comosus TaxID=4615 RepID=A0A6P5FSV1_ANACO|nr:peroxisomal membrane protein 13-like isoform X1 [Ananas comosus]
MATNSPPPGNTLFKPPSSGSTSDVVEASGTAKPGEIVPTTERSVSNVNNTVVRPVPPRPWQQNYGNTYGAPLAGYGGYGSGMYGSGGYGGGSYGSGLYGSSMYSGYGGLYGNTGMYSGGMYNSGFGGPMGGYGMGMGGPYNNQDPNNPGPPSPPGFWMSFLRVMHGVVNFFGRIAMLIDQNTQAFHMFMSALLQLFDRSGLLYGELARFVLRILGVKTKPGKAHVPGPGEVPAFVGQGGRFIEAPKDNGGSWDNVWGGDVKRES